MSTTYPPYATADENDAAYAAHVSASHAATLVGGPLNIHIGERENARVRDQYTGKWYWDCHRTGTKFNRGHRNPQIRAALREAIDILDAGDFALLSGYRSKLADQLVASTGGAFRGVTFGVGGADSIEISVHAARNHTGRRDLVSISQTSYHGGTDLGLSLGGISGDQRARYQVEDTHVTRVPYNDLKAMEKAVTDNTAAVVIEPSPAQGGFPYPADGYLPGVRAICDAHGVVMIADEIQTGVGGSGTMWAYQQLGFVPDIFTSGKGLGGGYYPISASVMKADVWHSYTDGQMIPNESTYGGSELGCVVASTVLKITDRPEFLARVQGLTQRFKDGFAGAPFNYTELGLNMGIRTDDPMGTANKLLEQGIFVVPSFDDLVVPFRPILTMSDDDADQIIAAVRQVLG